MRKNCLINHVIKGKIEERMKVTGRRERPRRQLLNAFEEQAGTVNCKRKHQIAPCSELALEQSVDVPQDYAMNELCTGLGSH